MRRTQVSASAFLEPSSADVDDDDNDDDDESGSESGSSDWGDGETKAQINGLFASLEAEEDDDYHEQLLLS